MGEAPHISWRSGWLDHLQAGSTCPVTALSDRAGCGCSAGNLLLKLLFKFVDKQAALIGFVDFVYVHFNFKVTLLV